MGVGFRIPDFVARGLKRVFCIRAKHEVKPDCVHESADATIVAMEAAKAKGPTHEAHKIDTMLRFDRFEDGRSLLEDEQVFAYGIGRLKNLCASDEVLALQEVKPLPKVDDMPASSPADKCSP